MPAVLGFRRRCSLAKPSNRWRTDGRQAMGHSTGWKVNINVDKIIVRVEDKYGHRDGLTVGLESDSFVAAR